MKYDPRIHNRRSIRLPHYNYDRPGWYFLTLCTHQRQCLFGEIIDGQMKLNIYGEIVAEEWMRSPEIRQEIALDAWVVMPNHFHGLVEIIEVEPNNAGINDHPVGANGRSPLLLLPHRSPLRDRFRMKPRSISSFVSGFKSAVTCRINTLRQSPKFPVWQRNYYEHIVRNDRDLERLRDYIVANPYIWHQDQLHPNNPSKW